MGKMNGSDDLGNDNLSNGRSRAKKRGSNEQGGVND